ncbi:MAG: hypothetical protein R3F20_14130 [Planctomycetota bacterium]
MADEQTPGCALVHRFIDDDHEAIIARVDVSEMAAAFAAHAKLWRVEPDPLGELMMRQFLGAASLYLSSRPTDEVVAWTLNVATPPMNLFVTGDTVERRVTGRVFTDGVRAGETSRLFVDTRRSQGQDRRSVIEVEGLDVLLVFEQFADRSDQALQRFFELDEHTYLMVASLPTDARDWIQALDVDEARRALEAARPLDDRAFWFQCGCTKERIVEVVAGAWSDRPEELFRGEDKVVVTCPRCGRRWPVTPRDLDPENDDAR